MSVAAAPTAPSAHAGTYAPRLTSSVETLRRALLWMTGLFGAFVFMEPSPYEIAALLAMVAFLATGLTLSAALMPLAALLIFNNLGFAIAVIPVLDRPKTLQWVLVSAYLAATALFFAAMLGRNTQARLSILLAGYTLAAVIAALAGIVGYFRLLPATDLFLLYDRARGTFNDPNVLGAFVVLPGLIAFTRVLAGRPGEVLRSGIVLMILLAGLLLSFSRGAWVQFATAAALTMGLLFVTSRSTRERMRIVLVATIGLTVIAAFIAALLSIDQVAGLFKQRASLEQSYDLGPMGRFGRHVLGFMMALDYPLGIGPLQFPRYFPEDPHNSYLNAFMSGGWLAGLSYLILIATTLALGLRFAFVTTPWRPTYIAVYAAFVGTAVESAIIDTDHWRHYFLIIGVLWGLMAASRPYMRRTPAVARPPQNGVARPASALERRGSAA